VLWLLQHKLRVPQRWGVRVCMCVRALCVEKGRVAARGCPSACYRRRQAAGASNRCAIERMCSHSVPR
jgi:hypothetical protein